MRMRVISDASFATSVPAIPIKNPTFAVFRAGPSFVPSPATPTISPSERRVSTRILSSGGAGRHLETRDNLGAVVWIKSTEDRAFHYDLDCNTGVMTGGDGLTDTRAKGVLDTGNGNQGHVAREVFVGSFDTWPPPGTPPQSADEVPVAECESSQHLVGIEDGSP